jgi:hypothetical protein
VEPEAKRQKTDTDTDMMEKAACTSITPLHDTRMLRSERQVFRSYRYRYRSIERRALHCTSLL